MAATPTTQRALAAPVRPPTESATVGLLAVAKATVFDPLAERFALLAAPQAIDFQMLGLVLVAACVAVSALGSGLTLRRFLRI